MTGIKYLRSSMLLYIAMLTVILSGCSSNILQPREVTFDPAVRRVIIFNDTTRFLLMETGVFNQSFHPGESLNGNVGCFGNVKGLVDAYAIVGHDKVGSPVLEWYGQRQYRLYFDAKDVVVRGESVDTYRVFTDNDFYPGGGKETWTVSDPCRGPSMILKFGR